MIIEKPSNQIKETLSISFSCNQTSSKR